jgi:hypothetical protein
MGTAMSANRIWLFRVMLLTPQVLFAVISSVLMLALLGCASNRGESVDDMTARFDATVLDVQPMGSFEGEVKVAALDPRFVVSLKVLGDVEALGLTEGTTAHFAIHSPTKLFAETEVVGRSFSFELRRRTTDQGASYRLYCDSPLPSERE